MLKKAGALINQWIEYLLFSLGFTMTLLVAVQVFCRYVLNQSLFWSEELARYLLVWLTFLGVTCAYHRKANPGVDFLFTRVPHLYKKIFTILTHLASMGLFIIMIVYGSQFAYFVRLQTSPALQIPKWIVLIVFPVSGAVLLFYAAIFLFGELKGEADDR